MIKMEFKTEAGKKLALKNPKKKKGIRLIEDWIHYGRLPPMTYMILPSLIDWIKSGEYKVEYEAILKELNPEGFEEYEKTKKIDSYSKK
jgi:hypothetical protein